MLHPTISRVALILSSLHYCTHLKFQDPNSAKKDGNADSYPILNCSNPQNIQHLEIKYSNMPIRNVQYLYFVVLLIFPLSWDQEANRVLCKITEVKCKRGRRAQTDSATWVKTHRLESRNRKCSLLLDPASGHSPRYPKLVQPSAPAEHSPKQTLTRVPGVTTLLHTYQRCMPINHVTTNKNKQHTYRAKIH